MGVGLFPRGTFSRCFFEINPTSRRRNIMAVRPPASNAGATLRQAADAADAAEAARLLQLAEEQAATAAAGRAQAAAANREALQQAADDAAHAALAGTPQNAGYRHPGPSAPFQPIIPQAPAPAEPVQVHNHIPRQDNTPIYVIAAILGVGLLALLLAGWYWGKPGSTTAESDVAAAVYAVGGSVKAVGTDVKAIAGDTKSMAASLQTIADAKSKKGSGSGSGKKVAATTTTATAAATGDGTTNSAEAIARAVVALQQKQGASHVSAVGVGVPASMMTGGGNTFETIKGGDRECIVFFNGVRFASTFVFDPDSKAKCDMFAAMTYSQHRMVTPTIVETSVGGGVRTQVTTSSSARAIATASASAGAGTAAIVSSANAAPNWCVRNKQKYDCRDRLSVERADGTIWCRPANALAEPGEKPCSGIQ